MNNKNKEITNTELLESINRSFTNLENKIEGKIDTFKLETHTRFNDLESDLKSFKLETRQNFAELNAKFYDDHDTIMHHDKRIETLEKEIFV